VGCDGSGRIIPYSGRIVPQQALELTIMQCAGRWALGAGRWQVLHGSINGGFLRLGQDQGFELWALKSRIWDLGSGIWDLDLDLDFGILGFVGLRILVF
jgi:hypothetical protein